MRSRLSAARAEVSRFLHWWLSELQLVASDLVGLLFPGWRQVMIVCIDEQELTFFNQASVSILKIPYAKKMADLPGLIPEAVQSALARGNRVRIIVNPSLAYVRQLEMPLAASDFIGSAIALQFPKWLPVSSMDLLTDFEIKETDVKAGRLTIDLAAIKKAQVDQILDRLRSWGLRIVSMHLGESPTGHYRFKFLHGRFSMKSYNLRRADKWLLGSAAALCVLCPAIAGTQTYRSQRDLNAAVMATRAPATAALKHRQRLLSRLGPLELLSQLEATASVAALLSEVTALVPNNTWLTTFEIKERNLKIVGLSPDSAAVVRHLSSSSILGDASLRSSTSAGIGTGLDRFEITAHIKGAAP